MASGMYWGMGHVVRGAGGSTGQTRSGENWPALVAEAEKRFAESQREFTAPKCPRDSTPLTWYDGWGYRCDDCYTFVCIPRQTVAPDA